MWELLRGDKEVASVDVFLLYIALKSSIALMIIPFSHFKLKIPVIIAIFFSMSSVLFHSIDIF